MSKSTKIIGVLALVAAVLLGVWFTKDKPSPYGVSEIELKKLEKNDLPEGFPKDFPVDSTAMLLENPQTGQDGSMVVRFGTNLASNQALLVYKEYFEKNGWQVFGQMNEAVAGAITAKSPVGDILSLTFSPKNKTQTVVFASLVKAQ